MYIKVVAYDDIAKLRTALDDLTAYLGAHLSFIMHLCRKMLRA
jgi:hypothetical protein